MQSVRVVPLLIALTGATAPALAQPAESPPFEIVRTIGHSGAITALAFSPDGKTVATGSDDYTVKLWDAATGLMVRTIEGHPYKVLAVAFSGDGKEVFSVSHLGKVTVNVSDAATGRLIRTFDRPDYVRSAAFSPDGRVLATAGNAIELLDTTTGTPLHRVTFSGDSPPFAFSPDGRQLATGNDDRTITLWEVATGRQLRRLGRGSFDWLLGWFKRSTNEHFSAVAFSSDGRRLAAAGRTTLMQFDVSGGNVLNTIESRDVIYALASSPDGSLLATSSSGTIEIRNASTGQVVHKLESDKGTSDTVLAFSSNGRMLASGTDTKLVRLWDAESWRLARTIEGLNHTIAAVAVTADGTKIASDSFGGFTVLWEAATGRLLRVMEGSRKVSSGTYQYEYAIGFSPDDTRLASGSRPATMLIWEVATGKPVLSLKHSGTDGIGVRSVAFLPPGNALLLGAATEGRDPNTRELPPVIYDLASNKLLRTLAGEPRTQGTRLFVYPIAVSPDGRLAAAGSRDNVINLFDLGSGRRVNAIRMNEHSAYALAFSPDGTILATGNSVVPTRTIELWDVESGKPLRKIEAHFQNIRSLAFSPDNRTLASASEDQTIKLWNFKDGAQLGALEGHHGWVTSLAYTRDGRILVSGSSDGSVKIWRTDSHELLATLVGEPNGEWLVVTPEGFFEASGPDNKLAIVRGLEVYPVSAAYDALHRPDLVREKLRGDPQSNVKAAAANLDLATFVRRP